MFQPDNSPEATQSRAESNARAIVATVCELEVERRLRSPASADFSFGQVTTVQILGNNRYRLSSYVDAQNGFGANIRSDFVCVVEGSGPDIS